MIANANLPPSYIGAIVGSIDPISQGAATVTTGWVAAAKFNAFMATIKVGVMGALATVDAKLQQASDASGTGAKDITGKAITQLTAVASPTVDANNRQAVINCRQEELDIANGFTFVRLSVTVGVAATLLDGTLYGFYPEEGPASDNQAASVAQVVT